jgi:hypothetical protein
VSGWEREIISCMGRERHSQAYIFMHKKLWEAKRAIIILTVYAMIRGRYL